MGSSVSATVLRKAANVMRNGGYIKGKLYDYKGAHCALGAINAAKGYQDGYFVDIKVITEARALARMLDIPPEGIQDTYNNCYVTKDSHPFVIVAAWNNMLCDSAEQVACVMDATAELLEEEAREVVLCDD